MSALPIHPLGWDMRLSSILDGDLIIFVVERCWLMAGLTEAVLEDARDEMGSLGSLFYWLVSSYYFYWPVWFFVS